ncbi:hypothetical protein GUJ93_ZPchr0006g42837 [Zizania palustris]|uniref:Uncharacterized protein n=1 Tax=Zizania palustris TaxID=103762 RepID=A0A8J5SRN0_ZIZPA|nr:hypothetical protein GUJ93_ZPchr0006g42837 [Zizania palustris]
MDDHTLLLLLAIAAASCVVNTYGDGAGHRLRAVAFDLPANFAVDEWIMATASSGRQAHEAHQKDISRKIISLCGILSLTCCGSISVR